MRVTLHTLCGCTREFDVPFNPGIYLRMPLSFGGYREFRADDNYHTEVVGSLHYREVRTTA